MVGASEIRAARRASHARFKEEAKRTAGQTRDWPSANVLSRTRSEAYAARTDMIVSYLKACQRLEVPPDVDWLQRIL